MAFGAGGIVEGAGVAVGACCAFVVHAIFFINHRMRAIVAGIPVAGAVTTATVRAEHAAVIGGVGMATGACA